MLQRFVGIVLDEDTPDHSTISRSRRLIDLDSGAVVAVTLQAADKGDATTMDKTLIEAGMAVAELAVHES